MCYDFDKLNVLPIGILHDLPGNEWRRVQKATGYKYTIVNGQVTFEGDKCTGATSGQAAAQGHWRLRLNPLAL